VRISADKVSNSIVVFAGGTDFLMVRDLVSKLDLPRRQVYVEGSDPRPLRRRRPARGRLLPRRHHEQR